MRSPVSIALFFLLSGFFLFALLAALEHSRKALAIAAVCLVATVCIIVFLTPVRLPDWFPQKEDTSTTTTADDSTPATVTDEGVTTTSVGGSDSSSTTLEAPTTTTTVKVEG